MPNVSMDDCIPVLVEKVSILSTFIGNGRGTLTAPTSRDALWARIADVCRQARNACGAPDPFTAKTIAEAMKPAE